jgi:hypothetical protein
MVSLISACLVTTYHYDRIEYDEMTRRLKFFWCMHNSQAVYSLFITIFYWIFLYNDERIGLIDVLVHGTNFIGPVVDLFIITHPYHISHCIYPMICGIFYMIFSVLFQVMGGINPDGQNYIYPTTDWIGKPKLTTIMAFGAILILGFLHVVFCGLQELRVKIHNSIKRKSDEENIIGDNDMV